MEARDGIEPPNKALQTLPFSFWVPRHFFYNIVIGTVMLATLRVSGGAGCDPLFPSKTLVGKIDERTTLRVAACKSAYVQSGNSGCPLGT